MSPRSWTGTNLCRGQLHLPAGTAPARSRLRQTAGDLPGLRRWRRLLCADRRGRSITREETLALVAEAKRSGLVLQPGNNRSAGNICMCCGCCCGVLRGVKLNPSPARMDRQPLHRRPRRATCAGCGTCLDRCQMDALSLPDGAARAGPGALHRLRSVRDHLPHRRADPGAQTRGAAAARATQHSRAKYPHGAVTRQLGPGSMIRMVARSAVDRVIAKVVN